MTKCKPQVIILFLALLFLLFSQSALAVGVGVKPDKIDLNITAGKETQTEILVINVAEQPAIYEIYLDALEKNITISPNEFQLDPDATQIVKLNIKINSLGKFATNLSVVARPLSAGGLTAASGVKIPLTVTTSGIPLWWISLGIAFVGLVALLAIRKKVQKT